MKRLWNRLAREFIFRFKKTGLEQELNVALLSGKLTVPELHAAARGMAAESIVLLKNDKGMLPLDKNETVAVFGRVAVNYFTVGYGSGGDVIPPYRSSLMDGLREKKVKLDEQLAKVYADWCANKRNVPDEGYWGHWPMYYEEMPLKEKVVSDAAANAKKAIVVIGRAAGEDRENLLIKGSYYLTDKEVKMLDLVTEKFEQVCVIMDCGNIIDMSWTKKYGDKITSILYAWQGGMEGGYAVADILYGDVNPSGRLADTIAVDYESYPSAAHFGNKDANTYVEDIYVGYRYFETFCKEKALYPFGYGLSYTTFDISADAKYIDGTVTVKATVTNTGKVAGKQVVQVYVALPGGILGNPSKVLASFGKTETLAPGASQTLQLTFALSEVASYDDGGYTGHKSCYVLEKGAYGIEVGASVRDTKAVLSIQKGETEVVSQLHERMAVTAETAYKRMANRDGKLVYEDVAIGTRDLRAEMIEKMPKPLVSDKKDVTYADVVAGKATAEDFVAQLSKEELEEISHGHVKMNSCYGPDGNAGAFAGVTDKLRARGLPACITTDGPSGIRVRQTVALLPCGTGLASSFNAEGVQKLYSLISEEMVNIGTHMLLGPGINIHRNPLCGRNFEYFSEDPLLTGKMAAAMVRGVQSTGRSACPKHFACNNQETNRNYNNSIVSERALRQIYLKGFEIAVKEANPFSIMTSYNKINGVWSHYNYELVTSVLREEWGFDGVVITDWWMRACESPEFPGVKDDNYRVRAQVDVLMPGEFGGKEGYPFVMTMAPVMDTDKGITTAEAQRTALNVVNFALRMEKSKQKA